ncbi:MAG: helix-turn-helix domain-containing protein [Candidatus Hydrothermarchaeales archaeon]
MLGIGIYYRETTFQQRRYLFELAEQIGNISKACRQAKVSREHYYYWKPRYDKDGIEGLRHPKSHAVHNPKMIDPQIERRIIELKREHPSWGKKRIAQWIWKEHGWRKIVAVNTVKNVLNRHGLWKNGNKRRKIRNKGVTADKPNKTINIDLCFVPAEEIDAERLNFSVFFDRMDSFCVNLSENGEECTELTGDTGLDIFTSGKRDYDEMMDAYVLMRGIKGDKQDDNRKNDFKEIEKNADITGKEEELRGWKRRIRIERRKEDEEWQKYRDERIRLIKEWKGMSKGERKALKEEKRRSDEEWKRRTAERRALKIRREKEDEEWRNNRRGIKEQMNVIVTSLAAVLVILDNCTRKCVGLPMIMKGRRVTAEDVIIALEERLPSDLKYIISDNGRQFIAEAFQRLCDSRDIVHVRISPHRPATNGIAERFVRRVKEMLAEREWINEEKLKRVLNEVIKEYNDAPHQGLDGLSPNEYERRLKCVPSN